MNTYKYEVTLTVTAEAFDENDAFEMIQDAFAVGENCGVNVTEAVYDQKDR